MDLQWILPFAPFANLQTECMTESVFCGFKNCQKVPTNFVSCMLLLSARLRSYVLYATVLPIFAALQQIHYV